MDIRKLAEAEIQNFIFDHEKEDEDKLVLKSKEILGVPSSWIATQIKARKKSAYKLPLYYDTKGIVYPLSLNLEQSSSEATARFKSYIVSKWITSNKKFCDLTGGLGVDSFFLSSLFPYCDFSEPTKELVDLAKQNHRLLGAINLHYHVNDAVEFLADSGKHYDLIFIDPSRRTASQKKVYRFADCVPDIIALRPELYRHTDRVMIKASPLLDIQQGIKDLQCVSRVIIVSVDDECKELLFLCDQGFSGDVGIECYNIDNNFDPRKMPPAFEFRFSDERSAVVQFSDPKKFIYEPDASIMKGGAFKSVAAAYNLSKLQVNTHLYTSDTFVKDFPGRIFEIKEHVKLDKKLREKFAGGKSNIVLRNFPSTVEEIKKKTGLTDGGDLYLVGCTGLKAKFLFMSVRLR
ncbi:MAG: class I SAM-dependent methyltransferase [Bacteroidota bacterium]